MKLKTKNCTGCGGTGQVPAEDTGEVLRAMREKAGVAGAAVARVLGISEAFIYDLEKDKRNWTADLVQRYQNALEELAVGV